jgi:hypothetical protein
MNELGLLTWIMILFSILAIACFSLGHRRGVIKGIHTMKVRTINKGYAEWKVSNEGNTTFKWNTSNE